MRAYMRACTCTTSSVTRTCHAKCHAHARTNSNTIYFHEQARTHTYTRAAVYAWADTHIARTIRVSPRLHMQHNSPSSMQLYTYNRTHIHEFVQPYAQCTLHHASTRTYTYAISTRNPCYHAQACTCSSSAQYHTYGSPTHHTYRSPTHTQGACSHAQVPSNEHQRAGTCPSCYSKPESLAALGILPHPEHESWATFHRYHIFLRAARKYNFDFMRASRSQVPPKPGFSPGSPESALQILALPFGQTQNLLIVAARFKRHTRDVRLGIVFLYELLHSSHPHVLASS